MTREDEAMAPQIPGYQIGDLGGGLFAAFSIVGGLLSRELGNGGEYIDVAMTDVVASFSQAISTRHPPATIPGENGHSPDGTPGTTCTRQPTGYVTLAALEPKFWEAFCEETGREG